MKLAFSRSADAAWVAWPASPEPEVDFDEPAATEAQGALSPCARSLDDDDLAALVLRVCNQHEPSLASLYEATSGRVYGLVLRIVHQAALAEEVVEDVFWQVWREAPRFDASRGKVMAWLLAIARSRAIDALRRSERVRAAEVAVDGDDAMECLATDFEPRRDNSDPLDLLGASRHHARLHELVAGLEPLPRQLLALAFFRGCTHEEIAEQTGMALGTVKSQIRRTLVALRVQLAPHSSTMERMAL
jgi:RNA polymerase sigma-70 factor (ECF subfamily)